MSEVDVGDLDDDQLDELQERLDRREEERNAAAPPPDTTTPKIEPWNTDDDWTNLSEVADRLIEETTNVEFDDAVVVTLQHEGAEIQIRFPVVRWLNTGREALFDQYYRKFGERLNIDERDWGILQERWLHRYLSE